MRLLVATVMVSIAIVAGTACRNGDVGAPGDVDTGGGNDAAVGTTRGPSRAEFGLDARPSNTTCKAPARPPTTAPVKFEQVYANINLTYPTTAAQRPGDGSRWYVAQREGNIIFFAAQGPAGATSAANIANGSIPNTPGIVTTGEGGLLGLAFHPKFAQNGKLYLSFTGPARANPTEPGSSMRSFIGELTSTSGGDTFTSYRTILEFDQTPGTNHKGGGLAFGKDGFLYASFGDGGGADDTYKKGQTKDGLFSKVLRIDVDSPANGKPYGIPTDNPFRNGGGAPETFAMGFRNPFRISIDRESGDLLVGDVGQNRWEEVDLAKLGGNYGWPCREGAHDHLLTPDHCPDKTGLVDPIVEHQHAGGRSITGGVVYRGKAIPALVGSYVYGDYGFSELFIASADPATGAWKSTLLTGVPQMNWVAFVEDVDGEIYALAINQSTMFKLLPAGLQPPDFFPKLLSETGCVDVADAKKPAPGLIPYRVNAELWSDGAEKERFFALPDGTSIAVGNDGDFDLPVGSVVMKSFKLAGKHVETRLLVRHDDGAWAGYDYEWDDAQTDASLLPASKTKTIGAQSWYYPSRADCARCHTDAAGKTLGLEVGQLNGDFVYAATNHISNQLKTLNHIGLFTTNVTRPFVGLPVIPSIDGPASLEERARAYLHANCSNCHRPKGPGGGAMDLRFATSFRDTNTCNVTPERGDLGIVGAKLIRPGTPETSVVSIRSHRIGATRMPPVGSNVIDGHGLGVLDVWVKSLSACP
jgi:uncharacterized repeat protein (TIGR03806 family)